MCLQGVDGHRSPGSLQLFVPVVPHFCCATCTRALFRFYLRDLQLVSRVPSPGSKAAFPLSEGSSRVRRGEGGEGLGGRAAGRSGVSGWVGAAPLPRLWPEGLRGTPSTSVRGGRFVSSPAGRNGLAQGSGDEHSLSTRCSSGGCVL